VAHDQFSEDPFIAWENGDVKTAFRLFRAQAEAGDENAFLNLGYFYDIGLGTRKSRTEAFRWYRRAYRRGDGAAASNIAIVYRDEGRHRLAFEWFKRAASMNDGDAEVEIAKLLMAKHRGSAVAALRRALASRHITEAGREEAQHVLKGLKGAQ
jgi:TPR repeat protein